MSLGNGRVMELKLIKHDEALQELKEVWSAWTIEQNDTTPWMEQGVLKRLNDWAARLQNTVDEALTTAKQRMSLSKVKLMRISK